MNREGLHRIIRAAAAMLGEDTVVIIGSQSILASFRDFMLPDDATMSAEADIFPSMTTMRARPTRSTVCSARPATSPRSTASTRMGCRRGRPACLRVGTYASFESKTRRAGR